MYALRATPRPRSAGPSTKAMPGKKTKAGEMAATRRTGGRKRKAATKPTPASRPRLEPSIEELERDGTALFRSGAFIGAAAAYRKLLDRLRRAGTAGDPETERLAADIGLRLAASLRRAGDLKTARTQVERSLVVAPGAREIHAGAHVLLSEIHLLTGNMPLAELSADKALELTQSHDEPARAWALGQRGRILWAEQFHEDAHAVFLQSHATAERHGDYANAAQIAGNVGMCLLELGRLEDARTWVARAVRDAGASGAAAVEARWIVGLARVALAAGAIEEADHLATRASEMARPLRQHLTVFRAEWLRHYIVALSEPGSRDRGRLSALRTLRSKLADFEADREMRRLDEALRAAGAGPAKGIASFTEGCDPIPPPPLRSIVSRAS